MSTRTKHLLDAAPALAALVVTIGEAATGVLTTTPGLTVPFGVMAAIRIAIAVGRILAAPPPTS